MNEVNNEVFIDNRRHVASVRTSLDDLLYSRKLDRPCYPDALPGSTFEPFEVSEDTLAPFRTSADGPDAEIDIFDVARGVVQRIQDDPTMLSMSYTEAALVSGLLNDRLAQRKAVCDQLAESQEEGSPVAPGEVLPFGASPKFYVDATKRLETLATWMSTVRRPR